MTTRRATANTGRACRKWPTTSKPASPNPAPCAAGSRAQGQTPQPAAGHRELRPRPHHALCHRRQLALEDVDPARRQDAPGFLAADPPLPGDRFARPGFGLDAPASAVRYAARARPRRGSRSRIQAGGQRRRAGAFLQSGWLQRDFGAGAQAPRRGRVRGRMDGGEAGDVRRRDNRRPRAAGTGPRPAELPPRGRRRRELSHLAEPRVAEQAVRRDRRALLYARSSVQTLRGDLLFGGGNHHARDPRSMGHARGIPAGVGHSRLRVAAAPEVGRRMKTLVLLLAAALGASATTYFVTISGLGGEADYTQRFNMWARDIGASLQ